MVHEILCTSFRLEDGWVLAVRIQPRVDVGGRRESLLELWPAGWSVTVRGLRNVVIVWKEREFLCSRGG